MVAGVFKILSSSKVYYLVILAVVYVEDSDSPTKTPKQPSSTCTLLSIMSTALKIPEVYPPKILCYIGLERSKLSNTPEYATLQPVKLPIGKPGIWLRSKITFVIKQHPVVV